MGYHETFWVVVGTAAPVIALAAVVALPDTASMYSDLIQKILDTFTDTREEAARLLDPVAIRRPFQVMAVVIQWVAIGNVLLQAALLAISLVALVYNRDVMPPWVAIVLAVGGILLLALIVSAVPAYRRVSEDIADAIKSATQTVPSRDLPRSGDGND